METKSVDMEQGGALGGVGMEHESNSEKDISYEHDILRVIHPIHDGTNSQLAFAHALKLAQISKGKLEVVDVRTEEEATRNFSVRELLEQWDVLPIGSHRSDVANIGLKVKKIVREGNKFREIVTRLKHHNHDLLVVGFDGHRKKPLFGRSFYGFLADHFHRMSLFIPLEGRSFINEKTGIPSLNNVIVPVKNESYLYPAISGLRRLLSYLPGLKPKVIGVHAGAPFPKTPDVTLDDFWWKEEISPDAPVSAIANAAQKQKADLIVMATSGKRTISDKLFGSITENVMRNAPCAVLYVAIDT